MIKKFNKKNFKKAVFIFLILFAILELYRYCPLKPMQDLNYKRKIVWSSHNLTYTVEGLRPLMGKNELEEFLIKNNNNVSAYLPSSKNIMNGVYCATLHTHSNKSDGDVSVKERLDSAQHYAKNKIENGYMLIGITDHNTVLGAKEVIRVLENNKGKYDKIKVVPGMEIYTAYKNSNVIKENIEIHVLVWCINPYDKFLNKEFFKQNLNDKWNRKTPDRDFDWVISRMSQYGIVGIAHPARYTTFMKENKYKYIPEMFTRYKKLCKSPLFTEGYYQSYMSTSTGKHLGDEYNKYIDFINAEADRLGILKSGSTDAHGESIFLYRSSKN